MKSLLRSFGVCLLFVAAWANAESPRYLTPGIYTADPSAHVFDGRLYVYPSHDIESGIPQDDLGSHFNMQDYHVFSMDSVDGEVTDHGVALSVEDVPWAKRQMWAPDCAHKDGKYYLYFPAKDYDDVFQIGVAVSDKPEGPFKAEAEAIPGSYSIDPSVFEDEGKYYLYFGGIWGGQLQQYRDNQRTGADQEPASDEPALCPKVALLDSSMRSMAEEPRDVLILDEKGDPLLAGDNARRFFEAAWVHKHQGRYYLSYSTGDTHNICYATADSPYGPFTYQGVVLTPVVGWTNHHSIVKHDGRWLLFHHDSQPSGGQTHLRSIKVAELQHDEEGRIETVQGGEKQ
ncbi:Xylosidase/arabinosidase [Pseudobythopirellula maris]|uniref:Xylosidase/arabinosidase n=1 Tax=Pseudobythopirellula maris TaxID=2527991 RepID=A0A5C5ZS49_9BACT|nr:glycoside hydrolase family 43 protein [Pseudobythopirellula maris]TWT89767.1 Xylosidase/arabinosidase [Pseudobythopirellula maris]